MKKLGLIGKNISYSFSKGFFTQKFKNENILDFVYNQYDIENIHLIEEIFTTQNLLGLNVTIPYKEIVLPFLDDLSNEAKEIGAVNTIKLVNNKKIGYNTDCFGFENSLKPLLKNNHTNALILGTGGASKAIIYTLKKLNIACTIVSRQENKHTISYTSITKEIIANHLLIINCSPVGTFPNTEAYPMIPYEFITQNHLAYDLIYNPEKTTFLKNCEQKGAIVKNGLEMLELQAQKAWEIWTS